MGLAGGRPESGDLALLSPFSPCLLSEALLGGWNACEGSGCLWLRERLGRTKLVWVFPL